MNNKKKTKHKKQSPTQNFTVNKRRRAWLGLANGTAIGGVMALLLVALIAAAGAPFTMGGSIALGFGFMALVGGAAAYQEHAAAAADAARIEKLRQNVKEIHDLAIDLVNKGELKARDISYNPEQAHTLKGRAKQYKQRFFAFLQRTDDTTSVLAAVGGTLVWLAKGGLALTAAVSAPVLLPALLLYIGITNSLYKRKTKAQQVIHDLKAEKQHYKYQVLGPYLHRKGMLAHLPNRENKKIAIKRPRGIRLFLRLLLSSMVGFAIGGGTAAMLLMTIGAIFAPVTGGASLAIPIIFGATYAICHTVRAYRQEKQRQHDKNKLENQLNALKSNTAPVHANKKPLTQTTSNDNNLPVPDTASKSVLGVGLFGILGAGGVEAAEETYYAAEHHGAMRQLPSGCATAVSLLTVGAAVAQTAMDIRDARKMTQLRQSVNKHKELQNRRFSTVVKENLGPKTTPPSSSNTKKSSSSLPPRNALALSDHHRPKRVTFAPATLGPSSTP